MRRSSGGERARDERAAQRVTARPGRVESHEVHAVPVERLPRERVPEHELQRDGDEPRRRPAHRRLDPPPRPEAPGGGEDEHERDDDLPGQCHDLGDRDADRVERRVEEGHDRLERRRRSRRSSRERHRVLGRPLVEAGHRARGDEAGQRAEGRGGRCGEATQREPAAAAPMGRPRSAQASLRSARRPPRAAAVR